MEFRHHIDELLVEEPGGFAGIAVNLLRGERTHGMMVEASSTKLTFTGVGANYLRNLEQQYGQKAQAVYTSEFRCEPDDDWEEMISGKLNFGKYSETCGTECSVSITVEQQNCTMLLKNLEDQKVDLDSLIALDRITALQEYDKMGMVVSLPPRELFVSVEGSVKETLNPETEEMEGDIIDLEIFVDNTNQFAVRPTFADVVYESINESQLIPTVFAASNNGVNDSVISPVLLYDDEIDCSDGNLKYKIRFKGAYDFSFNSGGSILLFRIQIAKGEYPDNLTYLFTQNLSHGTPDASSAQGAFDYTFTNQVSLDQGEGLYTYIEAFHSSLSVNLTGKIVFDKETSVEITAAKSCPATDAKMYPLHESFSRVVESITAGCLRVKSDYYGRTDSEPFAATVDGCGGLRAINSGLQLRNAENAKLFVSLKEMFDNNTAHDNIGYGIEPDPLRPGFEILRIEPVEYFYKDEEILFLPYAKGVNITVDESRHYSSIKSGYEKWEVENLNGINEIHSQREFRTSITSIKNPLDIRSKFIAASNVIENTRQQTFAKTGGADTKYDNEIFIYCLKRNDQALVVEQGNVADDADVYSPGTIYNWRIRPISNLMRWFKTIASSYPNISDTDNKIFFTSGTGNYIASGKQQSDDCRIEAIPKAENGDVRAQDFAAVTQATPLWRPKPIKVTYPLSVRDYKKIKANPYGYISVQCGNGDVIKGYIDSLKVSPIQGEADFTLRMKW